MTDEVEEHPDIVERFREIFKYNLKSDHGPWTFHHGLYRLPSRSANAHHQLPKRIRAGYNIFVKFFADEMLGKLARWLRMSGLDVRYQRQIRDSELIYLAREESRILLTRDTHLIKRLAEAEFLFISRDHLPEQIKEFYARFPESRIEMKPFSRCVECNTPLEGIDKEQVKDKVWPYVYQTQENFTTCPTCKRIYWEATHVERIKQKLAGFFKDLEIRD
jgi:uncharacterized protein